MNEPLCFSTSLFSEETFSVTRFYSYDDGINSHTHFWIEFITQQEIKLADLVETIGHLRCDNNWRHGIIASAYDDGHCYQVELVSPLCPLLLNQQSRVFVNKKLSEILIQIFPGLIFKLNQDILVPYLVQHKEIDYKFFKRILKHYNWSWIYQHDENNSKILIIDDLGNVTNNLGIIENLTRTPITHKTDFFNEVMYIKTDNKLLQAGSIANFQDKNYRILKIEHHQDNKLKYYAKLKLISPNLKYYTKNPHKIIKYKTPHLTATTELLGEQGQYYTRLYFDQSDIPPTQASQPQYLIEPHDGMHFPVLAGTQMVVSHIDGNVSQPILFGVIDDDPPVTSANNSQHIYQTVGGNQLFVEDKQDQQQIKLNNPEQQNIFLLDATQQKTQAVLQSSESKIHINTQKNITTAANDSHYQQSKNHKLSIKNNQLIQAQKIQLQSGKHVYLTAKNNVNIKAKSIQLISKKQGNINTKNNLSLHAQKIILKTTKNNFVVHVQKDINFNAKNNISVQSSGSGISMNGGVFTFNAQQLKINAQSISCPQPSLTPAVAPPSSVMDDHIEITSANYYPVFPRKINRIGLGDKEFKLFVATVYGEAGNLHSAWEPVADTIMTRANNQKQNVRSVITAPHQFSCYTDPKIASWGEAPENNEILRNLPLHQRIYWNEHGQFLKAWAYLHQKKNIKGILRSNGNDMALIEQIKIAIKPYYEGQVKNKINYYYSPATQESLHKMYPERYRVLPDFLEDRDDPESYRVNIPGVPEKKFKFYYIPEEGS